MRQAAGCHGGILLAVWGPSLAQDYFGLRMSLTAAPGSSQDGPERKARFSTLSDVIALQSWSVPLTGMPLHSPVSVEAVCRVLAVRLT